MVECARAENPQSILAAQYFSIPCAPGAKNVGRRFDCVNGYAILDFVEGLNTVRICAAERFRREGRHDS